MTKKKKNVFSYCGVSYLYVFISVFNITINNGNSKSDSIIIRMIKIEIMKSFFDYDEV